MKDDLDKYISRRKRADKQFAENFESGYQEFKVGVLLNYQISCCFLVERAHSQHRRNRKPGAASTAKAKPLGKLDDVRRCTR